MEIEIILYLQENHRVPAAPWIEFLNLGLLRTVALCDSVPNLFSSELHYSLLPGAAALNG